MILVYGHKRSGTTWLGEMLGLAVPYLGEVFSVSRYPDHPSKEYVALIPELRTFRINGNAAIALEKHVEDWVEHVADGRESYIIKVPHPDFVPWLSAVLEPDHIVRIMRDPHGIVNSYIKNPQWCYSNIRLDWHRHLWHRPNDTARTDAEKLVKSWRRQSAVHVPGEILVRYEALCLDPRVQFQALYGKLGLPWDGIYEQMKPMLEGDETGFRDVKKTSADRAYAWRNELPTDVIDEIGEVLDGLR